MSTSDAPRAVDRMRAEHAEILGQLMHLRNSIEDLRSENVKERRADMDRVVRFFEEHLDVHTARENNILFPAVEKHVGSLMVTATLRVEHRYISKHFDTLRILAAQPTPDASAFTRRVDNLIGLFEAHFQAEEEVLGPWIEEMKGAADH